MTNRLIGYRFPYNQSLMSLIINYLYLNQSNLKVKINAEPLLSCVADRILSCCKPVVGSVRDTT